MAAQKAIKVMEATYEDAKIKWVATHEAVARLMVANDRLTALGGPLIVRQVVLPSFLVQGRELLVQTSSLSQ